VKTHASTHLLSLVLTGGHPFTHRNILEEPTETSGGAEAPKKGSKNKSTSPVPSKSPATGAKAKAGTGSKTKTGVKGKK